MKTVPAPPGYWWVVAGYVAGKPIQFYETPVLAWKFESNKLSDMYPDPLIWHQPVSDYDDVNWTLDMVLECPNGRCIRDSGKVLVSRAAWIDDLRRKYEDDNGIYTDEKDPAWEDK